MANILATQSAEMRAKGEAPIQQADKLPCESWNERMWSDGEPIDPSPTIDQAVNGGFPGWRSSARGARRRTTSTWRRWSTRLLQRIVAKVSVDKERSWIDPFSDFIDASEEIRNHYRLISGMTFADALLRKWIIDSLLACVQIHLHLLKSPIGGGRDRSIECSEMATERASVGRPVPASRPDRASA